MIRAVIIDDEQNNISALENLLKQFCPEIVITGTAENIQTGSEIITQLEPQLVFLDIEMPFGNSFDMLEKMKPVTFEVIFVTAFEKYAVRAFKYVALDYLLKPVNIEDLKAAVGRARLRIEEKKVNTRIESLLDNFRNESPGLKKIGLPVTDGWVFEEIENIVHLRAEGNYTTVTTKDGIKKLVSKNLKEFEDLLPPALFCRIHHSHIVNLNFIKKYYKGRGGYIELADGTEVEVSSRKKDEFLEKFRI
jgi:two-component system LytT family response regulator